MEAATAAAGLACVCVCRGTRRACMWSDPAGSQLPANYRRVVLCCRRVPCAVCVVSAILFPLKGPFPPQARAAVPFGAPSRPPPPPPPVVRGRYRVFVKCLCAHAARSPKEIPRRDRGNKRLRRRRCRRHPARPTCQHVVSGAHVHRRRRRDSKMQSSRRRTTMT